MFLSIFLSYIKHFYYSLGVYREPSKVLETAIDIMSSSKKVVKEI